MDNFLTTVVSFGNMELTTSVKKGGPSLLEAFQKLDEAKQRQILAAVLREFAQHGYANASTNRMVESAGISKGLLFYYFKNKEELFRYALEYSLEYIKREYVDKLDLSEPDFILRLQKITEVKMRAYLTNPLPFTFIASVQLNQDMQDVVPDLFAKMEEMARGELAKLYLHVDRSLFRDDAAPEHILNLIRWSFDGYSRELLAKLESIDLVGLDWQPYAAEFYDFLAILRKIFYKEGDHGHSEGK
ncbi:MAG: TetR/AcrR family transcriptional regulator [Bacillota bacterium]|nr:TetR/AcrR family transcriptional regulator [Bacillota bacterium]